MENCKKLLKKLEKISNQKDVANYILSCNLREELVAVSERKDICNAMGKLFFSYSTVCSLNGISVPEICTVVIKLPACLPHVSFILNAISILKSLGNNPTDSFILHFWDRVYIDL